ncbi:MAG TPA: hypothetical protein ENG31_04170 [Candidatus Thorarchaeota archaeon]|nr:MAG: hypothetical protein DRO73_03030 [Candidatus Thorarchaeota archaeon]RLI60710.1 MAG: hypothetical protein DRO93_06280 [Candidatus Thorarchaeota archaeon]HDD67794.1 hypothetical protein [Candidatus Thorarchaeota archaeon]
MSAKIRKLTDQLNQLMTNSEVDGCALVSTRGQLMAAELGKDVDDKAVSAMAAALLSIGNRVGTALASGVPKNIVIKGENKMVMVRSTGNAAIIATAPAGAKVGLIDFEMDKVGAQVEKIL